MSIIYWAITGGAGAGIAVMLWLVAVRLNMTKGKKTWKEAPIQVQAILLLIGIGGLSLILNPYWSLY